jgi:diguanylate cyclase (GGDEF)-like protein
VVKIEDFASQFEVTILSQDVDLSSRVKLTLEKNNLVCVLNTDFETFYKDFQSQPTHVIIFDVATIPLPLHELVEKVLTISQEVYIVLLVPSDRISTLQKYRKYNVRSLIDRDVSFIETHVLFNVFNLCEILLRTYQNEQLLDSLNLEKSKSEKILNERQLELGSNKPKPYQLRISDYRLAESKEELLELFYKQTPEQSWIYLKFIDSIQTFMGISSHLVPDSWVEGLSFKVSKNHKDFLNLIRQGELPHNFLQYLSQKFDTARLKFLPVMLRDKVDGVLVTTQDIPAEVLEDFSLFSLVYAQIHFESMPKYLDVEDNLTGLYNELFYKRLLEKEVDRSKRTYAPLSLIRVGVDRFKEIEVAVGKQATDELIKKLAELLQKTSRLPDFICRVSESEFTIVLTNCNRKGAAVRAERLRIAINRESYFQSGIKITISQGISEYPSLTADAEDLDETASRALEFISEKGGDKLCIYKAHTDHQPDFVVDS